MYYYQNIFVAVNLVLPILATLTVLLRFQARRTQRQDLKADDWAILLALIFTITSSVLVIRAVYVENYGDLLTNFTPEQIVASFRFLYTDVILFILILGLIKISVVLFYKRIFISGIFIKTANIYIGICAAWTVAGVFSAIFRSNPISAYWENMGETSYSFGVWNITMAVLDIVLDLGILMLPLPVIRNLNISTQRKLSVIGIFLLGIFCVVSSAVRLYYAKYLNEVDASPMYIFQHPVDATYITNSAALWSQIETSASIITANLPTLVPVMRKFQLTSRSMRSWLSTTLRGGSNSASRKADSERDLNSAGHDGYVGLSDLDVRREGKMKDAIKVDTTYTVSSV